MTNNQNLSLGSIYIIDISIYLDLPQEEQAERCTDCQLKEQSVYIKLSTPPPPFLGGGEQAGDRQTDRQKDRESQTDRETDRECDLLELQLI